MDKNTDPFYSASNIKELEKRLYEAKNGNGSEHPLIDNKVKGVDKK